MNQKCCYCRKKAVYWHSILKVIMCHACRRPVTSG